MSPHTGKRCTNLRATDGEATATQRSTGLASWRGIEGGVGCGGGQEPEKRGDSAPFDVCNQSREETSQPEERRSQGKQKMRLGGLDEGACSQSAKSGRDVWT